MRTFSKKPISTQQKSPVNSASKNDIAPSVQNHEVKQILNLQRTVGNREVQRILFSGSLKMSEGDGLIANDVALPVHLKAGSSILQLEAAGQAAVPPVYTQALHRLQRIDAALYQYFQNAGWNLPTDTSSQWPG